VSKILEFKEAQDIANKLCEAYGFTPPTCDYKAEDKGEQARLCNTKTVKRTTGWWLWKRTIEVQVLDPIYVGYCWEDALEKLDTWLNTEGRRRAEKADKLRDKRDNVLIEQKMLE
jgi:hypothetical protein